MQLYTDVQVTQSMQEYNLNLNELELKQSEALVIFYTFKKKLKLKINTTCHDALKKRMFSVQNILISTLPSVSKMLAWDEWIECENSFSERGMPGVGFSKELLSSQNKG